MKTNERYSSGRFDFDGAEGIAFWVGDSDTEPVVRVMFDELATLKEFLEENLPGPFPRATLPDAACREALWKQQLALARLAAERDAALAVAERVRAAVNGPHPANSGLDSFTLAHVSSALDEAPEPNQNETKSGQEFCFAEMQVDAGDNP